MKKYSKNKKNLSTFKQKKSLLDKTADRLVKQYDQNEKLSSKHIKKSVLDLFN